MKRLGDIYGRICDYSNLIDAFGKVKRGKQNRYDSREWTANLESRLNALLHDLQEGHYHFGDYHVFKVFDPKERTIHAASVRERVIHHAVINICGPRLEAGLIDDTYACRVGKGQLRAVHRAQEFAKKHTWCLKMDIRHYFDSIDQRILMGLLERKIKDRRVLELFHELLESYATEHGKGLPIGNLTSQYFANLYLDGFDRWAGDCKWRSYLRYMDDMLVFGTYEDLRELKAAAADYMHEKLTLTIKHGGELQPIAHGVEFLGYRVYPSHLMLNSRSRKRFRRRVRELDCKLANGKCSEVEYQRQMTALTAFVCHADSYNLRGKICTEICDSF